MAKVVFTPEHHDGIGRGNEFPRTDMQARILDEMECAVQGADYVVEDFDYQALRREDPTVSTSNVPTKSPITKMLPNMARFRSLAHTPINLAHAVVNKFNLPRSGFDLNETIEKNPNKRFCWLVLIPLLFLLTFILLCVQWRTLNYERWLRAHQCLSHRCLTASGRMHSQINQSISPCTNFYQYACGLKFTPFHPSNEPDTPNSHNADAYRLATDEAFTMHLDAHRQFSLIRVHRAAITQLTEVNSHAIIQGLKHSYRSSWGGQMSAKSKVAQLFMSCIERSLRDWFGTEKFMNRVARTIGGIWLLDRNATNETGAGDENSTVGWPQRLFWDSELTELVRIPTNWSWMDGVRRLQSQLHVPIFADFYVSKQISSKPRIVITADSALLVGRPHGKERERHIHQMLQLVAIESSIPPGDPEITARIRIAIEDVLLVSRHLQRIMRLNKWNSKSTKLGDLYANGKQFDWKAWLSEYFNEVSFAFTDDLEVYTRVFEYLQAVPVLIQEFEANYTRPTMERIFNNYLFVRSVESFAWHMSYDFTNLHKKHTRSVDTDLEVDCFLLVHDMFGTVLGSIFVENHQNEDAVVHAETMLDNLKSSAVEQVKRSNWLDKLTKKRITNRISEMKIKFSVPEIMTDDAKLDYAYRKLKISYSYIDNIFSCIQYMRGTLNRVLAGVADPEENDWLTRNVNVYDAKIGVHITSDELFVPTGALQPPVYHHTLPSVLNFAGFGSMVGSAMAELLGEMGSFRFERNVVELWTDESWKKYLQHFECLNDKLGNLTMKHYNLEDYMVSFMTKTLHATIPKVIADISGLDIARRAWAKWIDQVENGVENTILPGEHIEREKLFYIAYAQTFCEKNDLSESFFSSFYGENAVPVELFVNQVLSEIPDFASTFQCLINSTMNPVDQCSAIL